LSKWWGGKDTGYRKNSRFRNKPNRLGGFHGFELKGGEKSWKTLSTARKGVTYWGTFVKSFPKYWGQMKVRCLHMGGKIGQSESGVSQRKNNLEMTVRGGGLWS